MPHRRVLAAALLLATACGDTTGHRSAAEPEDGVDDVIVTSADKADGDLTDCQIASALAYANDAGTTYEVLRAAGVPSRSAKNIVSHRPYESLAALDAVPYVGPVSFERLLAAAPELDCTPVPDPGAPQVVFSPQLLADSHLARIAAMIDGAERSLDIAVYSFSDAGIFAALERAVARGVSVRMLFEPANAQHGRPEGTMSARLEDAGVDVRYVNKIMHHKFVLVDGPRDTVEQAKTGALATGSGNWSNSAGTRYDENTVFLTGHAEANLRFQREFNHLWENSRDLVWNERLTTLASLTIDDAALAAGGDDPALDAVFTSANFEVTESRSGPGFTAVLTRNAASDRMVEMILGARTSVRIASGHLRSRPIAEALLAKHQQSPEVDIRVYLDGQEYLSESAHRSQVAEQAQCLTDAGESESERLACLEKGFLWGFAVHDAGIPVRFKLSAYRWDSTYALQMHHKYIVVDDAHVASGSYNFSENAEHGTMENVVFYEDAGLARAFAANFDAIWTTGQSAWPSFLADVKDGAGDVPIVFAPMALTWSQVTELKTAIRAACPTVDDEEYRRNPGAHRVCTR